MSKQIKLYHNTELETILSKYSYFFIFKLMINNQRVFDRITGHSTIDSLKSSLEYFDFSFIPYDINYKFFCIIKEDEVNGGRPYFGAYTSELTQQQIVKILKLTAFM
jgi:hypothetical protein